MTFLNSLSISEGDTLWHKCRSWWELCQKNKTKNKWRPGNIQTRLKGKRFEILLMFSNWFPSSSPPLCLRLSGEPVASGQHWVQRARPAGPAPAWQGNECDNGIVCAAHPVCCAPPLCCPLHNHSAGNPLASPLSTAALATVNGLACVCVCVCHDLWVFPCDF